MTRREDIEFAEAAVEVLGPDGGVIGHACRSGTWFFLGAIASAVAFKYLGGAWALGITFIMGWALNEREKRVRAC